MNLMKFVFKYILRRKLRFFLTLLGITIGIATIAGLFLLGAEMETQVYDRANALGSDAMVTPQHWCSYEYVSVLEGEQVGEAIPISDFENISKVKGLLVSAPIIVKSTGIEGKPVTVTGINPTQMLSLRNWIMKEGEYLKNNDTFSIILGSSIAEKFNLTIGDILVIRENLFNITGVIEQTNTNDDISIYITFETASEIYNTKDKISFVFIRVDDISKMNEYIIDIQNVANVNVITNNQIIEESLGVIETVRNASLLMVIIAIIAGFFGIVNTMATAVNERKREIGILKSLGAKKSFIFKQFLFESFIIGFFGGILGFIVGSIAAFSILPQIFPTQYQSFQTSASSSSLSFDFNIFVFCILFSLGIAIIAGLYPAWRAAKLPPVEAMRIV
ncbi:MAG: ABC transporter permease [Thermoplasmatales archaeon]|nr:MAG: ABC transporter permease [Thermoplasmatales archaeon]